MNKHQKLVQQKFLNDEETVIKRLRQVYDQSLNDITGKISDLDTSISTLQKVYNSIGTDEIGDLAAAFFKGKANITPDEAKETLQSMIQSKVYQKKYQEALKKQVGGILDTMHDKEFKVVSEYLDECYENGFVGTMFDLQGQGIPMCFPLDQEQMVRAVQLDSKISKGLYTRLGEDVALLKKKITAQVSRGISTGMSFQQVAEQLAGQTNIGYNNAVRIARTEGHRIQCQAGMDACYTAKDKGADVLKQWDSTMDSSTRESHVAVDGEIRELDEKFSNGLMFPGDPAGGAAEVINCRCALLQRARWALDEDELKALQEKAAYFGIDKTANFDDFKAKYLKAVEPTPEPVIKPKKEYLTEKKLKQNIDDADAQLSDLHDQFKQASGGVEYDDIVDAFGSLDDFAKGDQLAKLKSIKKQMDDLEISKTDWQEKLNTKLVAKETKKLKKEQILLQDQLDAFDVKTYSNIWKDDVTTADWYDKQGSIAAKKSYFQGKLATATDPDDIKKWQSLLDDLDDFDKQGAAYYDIKHNLTKTKTELASLKKNGIATTSTSKSAFSPDAYGQRKTNAWNNRFTDKKTADNYYRPLLDAEWSNLSEEEMFSIWQYTHNSHPINRPLSGYDGKWGSRSRYFKGIDGVNWDNESSTNYDAVLHSNEFIKKFANGKSAQWGGDIRNYSDVISDLTKAIDKSNLQDDLWLVRGSDTNGLAGLLDGKTISFQQVENLVNSGDIQTLKNIVQNEAFQTHSFTSTGIASGTGFGGNVSYKIYAPKGTKGIYAEPQSYFGNTISGEELYSPGKSFYGVSGEAEVILQRGTSFRITDIQSKGYGNIEVTMEVIDQPDYFKTGYEHTFDGGLTNEK